MKERSRKRDRASRLERISPGEDRESGDGKLGVTIVAIVAGVVEVVSLVTLIDALGTGRVLPGLVAVAGIFVGFVAMFWAHSRLQSWY